MTRNEKPAEEKPKHYVQKFSNNEMLAEAVLIGNTPFFLVAKDGKVLSQDHIPFEDKILKPLGPLSYVNKPYVFNSDIELNSYLNKVVPDTLDSLYREVKAIWKKYVDADDFHLSICAADTIFTYFQDKIGLTHYLFFVGNPASGKSNNLTVFQYLAYRNMTSSDMSHSNIYQFLGSMDEGVGTLCEDEADNIDEYPDKMRIYKNGYTTGRPVLKTDTTYGRKQYRFNTFCFKAFAAERLPDSVKAKGFNQRIIEIPCVYGWPTYDISEVINPAGELEHVRLLDELIEIRNSLLIYRLQHWPDKLPDIKTNLQNREKQLFKPVLRVFKNTSVLKEILPVVSKYISQKREENTNSYYAYLYRVVKSLIQKENTMKLSSSLIWQTITSLYIDVEQNGEKKVVKNPDVLPGEPIPTKRLSYDSEEFGVISQKEMVEIMVQVFGAKASRNKERRSLTFDKLKLERLSKIYDISIDVKVGTGGVTDVTDVTDVGLDRHLNQSTEILETTKLEPESDKNYEEKGQISTHITLETDVKDHPDPNNASQASQASPERPNVLHK